MEARVRITFFLPVSTTNDRAAFLRLLDELRTRHPPGAASPPENSPITGFTYSADDPPAFHGNWWSESRTEWVPDRLVLLIASGPLGAIRARPDTDFGPRCSPQAEAGQLGRGPLFGTTPRPGVPGRSAGRSAGPRGQPILRGRTRTRPPRPRQAQANSGLGTLCPTSLSLRFPAAPGSASGAPSTT